MALIVRSFDLTNGLARAEVVAPGNNIGTLTVQDGPDAATIALTFGVQTPIPCQVGDVFDRLTPTDGSRGIWITVPAQAGTLTLVMGTV